MNFLPWKLLFCHITFTGFKFLLTGDAENRREKYYEVVHSLIMLYIHACGRSFIVTVAENIRRSCDLIFCRAYHLFCPPPQKKILQK